MSRLQRWLVIGIAVVLAAFLTGLVRGVTDTVPVQIDSSEQSLTER